MTPTAPVDIVRPSVSNQPLSQEELRKMNAYWRAANYLSVLLRRSKSILTNLSTALEYACEIY